MLDRMTRMSKKRMKTSCLSVLACSVLLAANAYAGIGPRISCKEPEYMFGDRPPTGAVEHVFVIENTGDAPLQIGDIRACCGGGASIDAKVIAPGSNANLKATLSMGGRRGAQKKSFYVASNDPNQPYLQLRMTGNGVADAYFDPENVYFVDVRQTTNATRTVRLVCSSNVVLSVTNIVIDSPVFKATPEKTAEGYSIRVAVSLPLKPGVTQGIMQILTDHEKYRQFNVHLFATLTSDIMVVPQELTLVGATGKTESVTRYISIRSKSNAPFKILSVEPPEPSVEVKVHGLPSGGYRIEMRNILPFPDLDGKRFVIRTDHNDGREIQVPVRVLPRPDKVK